MQLTPASDGSISLHHHHWPDDKQQGEFISDGIQSIILQVGAQKTEQNRTSHFSTLVKKKQAQKGFTFTEEQNDSGW